MPKREIVDWMIRGGVVLGAITLCGCESLGIKDPESILFQGFQRSEIMGIVAGFGTTFAGLPDLIKMFKRRSSQGINPTMAGIMGVFQIVWVYYGLLIASRPVVLWNFVAVIINLTIVGAYFKFGGKQEKA